MNSAVRHKHKRLRVFSESVRDNCRTSLVSSCTNVGMARLRSTLSTVAHQSPMLLAGSISGQPHSKSWCYDIGYPLLAGRRAFAVQGPMV